MLFKIFLILYCGIQYRATHRLIRIGVTQVSTAQPYEQSPKNHTHTVLVMGSSLAVGVGADQPSRSVAGYLGAEFPKAKIKNRAVSGLRLAGLVGELQKLPTDTHVDLMLIQIGGNDILKRTPLTQVKTDLQKVLALAAPMAEQIIIFHGGNIGTSRLLPWPTRWFFRRRTLAVRAIYKSTITDPKFRYVDMFRPHTEDPYFQNPSKYYSPDFFHPSGDGYKDWYELVKQQASPFSISKRNNRPSQR